MKTKPLFLTLGVVAAIVIAIALPVVSMAMLELCGGLPTLLFLLALILVCALLKRGLK